jgi:hypothetical protein
LPPLELFDPPELRELPEEPLLLGIERELLALLEPVLRDVLLDDVSLLVLDFLVSFEGDDFVLLLRWLPVLLVLRSLLLFFTGRSTFRSLSREPEDLVDRSTFEPDLLVSLRTLLLEGTRLAGTFRYPERAAPERALSSPWTTRFSGSRRFGVTMRLR